MCSFESLGFLAFFLGLLSNLLPAQLGFMAAVRIFLGSSAIKRPMVAIEGLGNPVRSQSGLSRTWIFSLLPRLG